MPIPSPADQPNKAAAPQDQVQELGIDDIRLTKTLGEGAQGSVFCAELTKPHKLPPWTTRPTLVAVKVQKFKTKSHADSEEAAWEAEAHRRAGAHPHILPLFAAFRHGRRRFLVTELAAGDVRDEIEVWHRGLPPPAALQIGLQVALAVHHLHGQGLAHCDLKPDNVLLAAELDPDVAICAKVADFGLAVQASDECLARIGGTLDYQPPEGLRGEWLDPREADVHAFGVLLYELLTGSRPYAVRRGDEDDRDAHLRSRAAAPSFSHRAWREVGDEVTWLVKGCLAEDWAERPSAGAVVEVLEAAVYGRDDLLCTME